MKTITLKTPEQQNRCELRNKFRFDKETEKTKISLCNEN